MRLWVTFYEWRLVILGNLKYGRVGCMVRTKHISAYHVTVFALASMVLIMAGLLYVVYAGWQSHDAQLSVVAGQMVMAGKIVCLPHKDQTGMQTMECAYGMQGADGTYYGLQGLSQEDLMSGKLAVGTKVNVHGTLQPAKSDEKYAVAGNIMVKSVE
jgi:hypothetical protein